MRVRLTVHDILGRSVAVLAQELLDAGQHTRVWTGTDESGIPVASGVYWIRLETGGESHPKTGIRVIRE